MGLNIKNDQRGFTIIEMLIATAILSTILVLVTMMMVNIGSLYYKGINQSKIQGTTRSVTEELAHQLELLDSPIRRHSALPADLPPGEPNNKAICLGTTRYTYALDKQLRTDQHVLWRDNGGGGKCVAIALNTGVPHAGGVELMPPNSRITHLSVSDTSPYEIIFSTAYGDTDLLNGVGLGVNTRCKGGKDQQFCSVANLQTIVAKRID